MSKIYFASDHAGFELKRLLILFVMELGYDVEDFGPAVYDEGDDYPDYILPCAKRVAEEEGSFGIVLGKSGQGEAMVANRVKGVRAVVYYGGSLDVPTLARHHNNANILSLAAGFIHEAEARAAIKAFLTAPFSNEERHVRRLSKF
jgi:ribose 5-phosphate isomerase B